MSTSAKIDNLTPNTLAQGTSNANVCPTEGRGADVRLAQQIHKNSSEVSSPKPLEDVKVYGIDVPSTASILAGIGLAMAWIAITTAAGFCLASGLIIPLCILGPLSGTGINVVGLEYLNRLPSDKVPYTQPLSRIQRCYVFIREKLRENSDKICNILLGIFGSILLCGLIAGIVALGIFHPLILLYIFLGILGLAAIGALSGLAIIGSLAR